MSFSEKTEINELQTKLALETACNQLLNNLDEFTYKFQVDTSENGFYIPCGNKSWTSGFWTGELWLAYENTHDERYKTSASIQVLDFYRRIKELDDINNHDMGFLYSLSCVSAYKLTKDEIAKKAAIKAADYLISRFNERGEYIQAWGPIGAVDCQRLIIDCLMNMPILFWTSDITGDTKYKDIATKHIKTTMKHIVREDNSTYHTYFFDPITGKPERGSTQQGYKDGSAWARGQSWGVYGIALAYKYLKDEKYIDLFYKVTDYFIDNLPSDLVPFWDFTFSDGAEEPRDSSAGVIAVCGMLEMSKYLPKEKSEHYVSCAKKILLATVQNCSVTDYKKSNGLLLHGTYAKSSPYNPCKDKGVDECNTWGDYFYLEALTRLSIDWNTYW